MESWKRGKEGFISELETTFYFLCARGTKGNYTCFLLCGEKNTAVFVHMALDPEDPVDTVMLMAV